VFKGLKVMPKTMSMQISRPRPINLKAKANEAKGWP